MLVAGPRPSQSPHRPAMSGAAPLVSVIIPTFNRRELVLRSVQSVLAQTYRPYEIIVQDDGSTDGTREALQPLQDVIDYAWQPNRGLAAARNAAIRRSRGTLIALLDSDDTWRPEKLRRCVDYLRQHPEHDVVYTPMATHDVHGRPMAGHDKTGHAGWILNELFESICIHDPAAVFYRDVWERAGGFGEHLPVCVGHHFWLNVAREHSIGFLPEPLAVRTWLKDSLTRGKKGRVFRIKAAMLESFFEQHAAEGKLDIARARRALAKTCLTAGRLTLQDGDIATARHLLAQSVNYCPTWRARVWKLISQCYPAPAAARSVEPQRAAAEPRAA